jgi:opacity protein-like surface antigen
MKTLETKMNYDKSMKGIVLTIFTVIALLMIAHTTFAQRKWSFELRPGVNFATKDLGDASLKTGFGIEGSIAYQFMPQLGAYAGWGWNKFSADQSFAGSKMDFNETGYCFGLQFVRPFKNSAVSYMIKGGGIYNHIETENNAGDIINDTGHGLGWQLGAGVKIPLTMRVFLTPEVRYRSLSRDIKTGEVNRPVDLNYVSAGVGLSFRF